MFISQNRLRVPAHIVPRSVVTAAFAAIATLGLNAQQNVGTAASQRIVQAQPVATSTLLAANDTSDSLGYSSSAGAPETAAAVNFLAPAGASPAMQPPPRRYGRRPIYADSSHNADGSNKYTFFGGAGFTLPTGGTHNYLSPSYNFQVGGGRNLNKKLAAVVQFDWANFGFSDSAKTYLLGEYAGLCGDNCTGTPVTEVGGSTHDWSFTLGPMYTFAQNDKEGAYVVGGVGFYHKVANITTPGVSEYCDPYYGCEEYEANETIDKYTSNSVGFNGGFGFTYKPSRFGNEKFYAEARYVYTANQLKPFYDGSTGTTNPTSNANYFNAFPQNSAKTTYIPITFGVRF
jgi:hypothetical protein